jgi:hypothetical protein
MGPRSSLRVTRAPGSTTTSPSMSHSVTSPSMRRVIWARTSRLASSRSSGLPVSFHQPRTRWATTGLSRSTSPWMASVISYSPRQDGFRVRITSWMRGLKR